MFKLFNKPAMSTRERLILNVEHFLGLGREQ